MMKRTSNNLHCGLRADELRTNSITAANIRLKEILKRRTLFGNQTVVLLTGSGALTNSCASNAFSLSAYGDSANIKLTARNEL